MTEYAVAQGGSEPLVDPFTDGYLAASDRAADALINRDDDPNAESERWLPPRLHGADAEEWRSGFESWWDPRGE